MNIQKYLADGVHITLAVSIADLNEFAQCLIEEASNAAREAAEASTAPVRYLTADEVCKRLSVKRPTLWRWEKRDYLTPRRVGGRVLYLESDVERIVMKECV